jgi:hypothetical protein
VREHTRRRRARARQLAHAPRFFFGAKVLSGAKFGAEFLENRARQLADDP